MLNAPDFCLPPNPNLSFFTLKPSAPSLLGCRLRKPSSQQLQAPIWLFLGFLAPFPDPFFPFPSHGSEVLGQQTPTANCAPPRRPSATQDLKPAFLPQNLGWFLTPGG